MSGATIAGNAGLKSRHSSCARRPARGARIVAAHGEPAGHQHQHRHAQQSRQDAAQQELDHRHAGDGPVDDERDRRRKDRPDDRRRARHRRGEAGVEKPFWRIASISMRPRPPMSASAEPDMPAKIRLPKMFTCARPPGSRPDRGVGELVDVTRDAGAVHQAADEQEHRHRDQRKRVERVERALRDAGRSAGPSRRRRRRTACRSRAPPESPAGTAPGTRAMTRKPSTPLPQLSTVCFSSGRRAAPACGRAPRRSRRRAAARRPRTAP